MNATQDEQPTQAQRPRAAYAMMFALRGVTVASSLVSVPVMGRLLLPEDYGVAAMVGTALGLAVVIRDLGLSIATIQMKSLSEDDFGMLFWANALSTALFSVLLLASAGPVSRFYGHPEIASYMLVSVLGLAVGGLTNQHKALLQRSMMFRSIMVAESAGLCCGLAAAISIALLTDGPLALVISYPVQAIVSGALALRAAPRMRLPLPPLRALRRLASVSGNMTAFNVATFVSNGLGQALVGSFLGAASLGYFNRAFTVAQMPGANMIEPMARVLHPVLARDADDPASYRDRYLRYSLRLSGVLLTVAAILPFISESLMRVLVGPDWVSGAGVLAWFAPAIAAQSLAGSVGLALVTQGRLGELRNWGVAEAVLRGTGTAFGLYLGGVHGAAAGYALCSLLVCMPAAVWLVGRQGPVSQSDQYRQLVPAVLMAGAAAAGCMACRALWNPDPSFLNLAVTSACGLLPSAIMASLLPSTRVDVRSVAGEVASRLGAVAARIPAPAARP